MRIIIVGFALFLLCLVVGSGATIAQPAMNRLTPYVPHILPPEAGGSPNRAVQVKAPVRQEPPISDETIKAIFSAAVITLASCTIILFILGCGSRVVVFADPADALMTACVFIAPIFTALSLVGIGMLTDFDNQNRSLGVWAFARENPIMAFALGVGLLWWVWAFLGTIISSIRHNGFIIGSLVAVMKLGAVFTMLLAWFASEHNKPTDIRNYGPHLVFLALLSWFASRYVNGHRVMERREMLLQARQPALSQA